MNLIPQLEAHMKQEVAKRAEDFGITYISDGWESVDSSPLINSSLVVPTCGAFFFASVDTPGHTKDAEYIAGLIISDLYKVGPTLVLHVCTDTCATMKAAWRIIEEEFPWVTCSGCAPHVGSLLLKV